MKICQCNTILEELHPTCFSGGRKNVCTVVISFSASSDLSEVWHAKLWHLSVIRWKSKSSAFKIKLKNLLLLLLEEKKTSALFCTVLYFNQCPFKCTQSPAECVPIRFYHEIIKCICLFFIFLAALTGRWTSNECCYSCSLIPRITVSSIWMKSIIQQELFLHWLIIHRYKLFWLS